MASAVDLFINFQAKPQQAVAALAAIDKQIAGLSGTAERSTGVMSKIGGALGTAAKVGAVAAGGGILAAGAALVKGATAGIGFNNSLEQTSARINAFTKDGAQTAKIIDMIRTRAAKTPFSFDAMAAAAAGLLPASKTSGVALEKLIGQAEVLAASNPAEGLEGAAFALREAVSGDFTSVIERFNLPRSEINKLKKEGVPALEAVSRVMKGMGLDADLVTRMGETASGRWSTFTDTLTGFAATATAGLFGGLSSGLGDLQGLLDANSERITAFATAVGGGLARAFNWVTGSGIPKLIAGFQAITPIVRSVWNVIQLLSSGDFRGGIFGLDEDSPWIAALFLARDAVQTVINAVRALAGGDIRGAFAAMTAGAGSIAATFGGILAEVGPPLLAALQGIGSSILAWITTQAPVLLAQLQTWGDQFRAWVLPQIPPMLAALAGLATSLWSWITAQAAPLLAQLQTWAQAFVAWIVPATMDFLSRWPAMFSQFLNWIGMQAGPLLAKLGEWAIQFTEWIIPMIPGLLLGLGAVAAALLLWIGQTVILLSDKIVNEWAPAFMDWINTAVVPRIGEKLGAMLTAINAWLTTVALPWALKEMTTLGFNIIAGIQAGITSAVAGFTTWLSETMASAFAGIGTAIDTVLGPLADFAAALGGIKLPWAIEPHSPTPLEMGLLGIADAAGVAGSALAGLKAPEASAFQKYLAAVREDGDYLNDWLTHLPKADQAAALAMGKDLAAGTAGSALAGVQGAPLTPLQTYLDFVRAEGDTMNDWLANIPKAEQAAALAMGKRVAAGLPAEAFPTTAGAGAAGGGPDLALSITINQDANGRLRVDTTEARGFGNLRVALQGVAAT